MTKLRWLVCGMFLTSLVVGSYSEARVGGGRSFGSRGARGFSSPPSSMGSPYRSSNPSPYYNNPYSSARQPAPNTHYQTPSSSRSTFLKSLGAGIAGGMLGGMLSRAFGWGGGGLGYAGGGSGGIGILEILVIGALLFFLIRLLFGERSQTQMASSSDGAASLMRKARSMSWEDNVHEMRASPADAHALDSTPIGNELAMDLFFKIQGAWAVRDLSAVQSFLDTDARDYLEREISRLKTARQFNKLDNIAVRSTDVVETWRESNREYSTVKILASLLDYTIDENTQQVLEGSKSDPIKFEEYWTFSREIGTSSWKLSAIQQN